MQEILVVIAIGLAIFFIPRLMNRNDSSQSQASSRAFQASQNRGIGRVLKNLPGWIRLLIFISILWIAGCAAYLKPWEQDIYLFIFMGLGPVLGLWTGIWVWSGFVRHRR